MHRTSVRYLVLSLILGPLSPAGLPSPSAAAIPIMSLNPSISFEGGSDSARHTVVDAVEQYRSAGLILPDLMVRIHPDNGGCDGKQGLFHHNGGSPIIDLCFDREFLILHELGHAWEHFNINDQARLDFQRLIGAVTWDSQAVSHGRRGIEIAADSLAHGLLSTPLECGQTREREFERFAALTGITTPRLPRAALCDGPASDISAGLAAYANWRQNQSRNG